MDLGDLDKTRPLHCAARGGALELLHWLIEAAAELVPMAAADVGVAGGFCRFVFFCCFVVFFFSIYFCVVFFFWGGVLCLIFTYIYIR